MTFYIKYIFLYLFNMSNFIQVFENSLSDRVCDNLIHKFENSINVRKGTTLAGFNNVKITLDLTFNTELNTHLIEYFNHINHRLNHYISEYKKNTKINNLPINFTIQSHMINYIMIHH